MNTPFALRRASAAAGAVSFAIMTFASPAGAGTDTAARVGLEHENELQQGGKLVLSSAHAYRVCIPDMPGNVKLKVIHDGESSEVLDGTCQTFTAKRIEVRMDSHLPPGDSLGIETKWIKADSVDANLVSANTVGR